VINLESKLIAKFNVFETASSLKFWIKMRAAKTGIIAIAIAETDHGYYIDLKIFTSMGGCVQGTISRNYKR